MSSQLHDDSYLVVNDQDVAAKVVDGEAILINLTSGLYYSMDKVGGFVWSLFAPGSSIAQVADAVAARYSVPPAQAREDVRRLARELLEENLPRRNAMCSLDLVRPVFCQTCIRLTLT